MFFLKSCRKGLADWRRFRGRASRVEFWSFHIFYVVVMLMLVLGYFTMIAALGLSVNQTLSNPVGAAYLALAVLMFIYMLIASVTMTVRRLHDRNLSGAWYALYAFLSIGQSAYNEFMPLMAGPVMWVGALLAMLVLVGTGIGLVLMCLPGTEGANSFGPDPRRPIDLNVFA